MKLQDLKAETKDAWEYAHQIHQAIAPPSRFKAEIRHCWELRSKATWIKVYSGGMTVDPTLGIPMPSL